jgi:hypothetical protein
MTFRRLVLTAMFPGAVCPQTLTSQDATWNPPSGRIYVVTQNHYAEGFSPQGRTARFTDVIMIEIFAPDRRSATQKGRYAVGGDYPLYLGGYQAGSVKVQSIVPLQCNATAAVVMAAPAFPKDAMGVATQALRITGHPDFRRPPIEAEREEAVRLAAAEFQKLGLQPANETNVRMQHAIITKLDNGGDDVLIGEFSLLWGGARHELFLVARTGGFPQLSRYHRVLDLEDGKDSQYMRLASQLDLDQDGTDELIVEVTGYESEAFWIYKRIGGVWKRVSVGGEGGC